MRRDWGDMRPKRRAWLPDGSHEVHRCRMASVGMESVHHLHCPTCDARLVEQAGRYDVMQRRHPVYVGEVTTLTCPAGHRLPHDRGQPHNYRDRRGHPPEAPVREVAPPR